MGNHVLLACGVAAGPVFTVAYLFEGVRRQDYVPRRHPVSSLALGPAGWVQTVNFLVAGLLSLAFAAGLWNDGPSRFGAVLIGVWALGLLGAGFFRTDPVSGYPQGTPDGLQDHTRAGAFHDGVSLVGFFSLAVAGLVFAASGSPGWSVYSAASGVLFAATMVLAGAAFGQNPRVVEVGGLIQRVSVTIGWAWTVALAIRVLRG